MTQLSDFINAHSTGRAVIVGGDFNLHTDSEPDSTQFQRLLSETGLTDVCASVITSYSIHYTKLYESFSAKLRSSWT